MAREQRGLDRGYRPSANRSSEDSMRQFGFLVVFPRLDESGSSVVAQVDAAARRVLEALGSDLAATYE